SKISTLDKSYGLCMYHEAVSDSYYVFVNSKSGEVVQLQLFTNAQDQIDAKVVRQFSVGSQTEGCVVDDAFNTLYIGEENVGIWKYGANPTDGQRRSKIDSTSGEGHLSADVEGLALYAVGAQEGYLLASSQGENAYTLYSRKDGSYLGKFEITDGVVDGTCETDGIAVTSSFLGDKYPEGILVVQDGEDTPSLRQNFKIIDFSRIKKQVLSAH
ncbi:MAG: phytase, partial [Campylobacterota bacterium]|nr:phytase [Campylobacterota bacterium]